MYMRYSEGITIRSLLIAALLALSLIPILLSPQLARAAPQRPLGTGCTESFYLDGWNNFSPYNNFFWSKQDFNCNYSSKYMLDDTYFSVSAGSAPWIYAQADTWLTQGPSCCGHTRYGETGRSSSIAYPNNGMYYYVQTAIYYGWLAPMYGCNWINWPDYSRSVDYNCALLE